MDIRYRQIRLVQQAELTGTGFSVTNEGNIITGPDFDINVRAYDQSYALKIVGISFDCSAVEVDGSGQNNAEIAAIWTVQSSEYRVMGVFSPTKTHKMATSGDSFDRDNIAIVGTLVKSEGQMSQIGYPGPTGPLIQPVIDAGGILPRTFFLSDDKARRIESLHGLRIRQTVGVPLPQAIAISIAVEVVQRGE